MKKQKNHIASNAINNLSVSIEVELSELPNYPNMTITACGDENLYFIHNGKKYFCKCLWGGDMGDQKKKL